MVGWHHQLNGYEFKQTWGWWRTGKPGVLQSMGSQRVRHDWVTEQQQQFRTSQVVLVVKNLPASEGNVRDSGSVSGLKRSSGGGHDYPFQYSCLENLMGSGAWRATVHRVANSRTRLKHLACMHTIWFSSYILNGCFSVSPSLFHLILMVTLQCNCYHPQIKEKITKSAQIYLLIWERFKALVQTSPNSDNCQNTLSKRDLSWSCGFASYKLHDLLAITYSSEASLYL